MSRKHSNEAALNQLARRVSHGNESHTQSVAQWELEAWHRIIAELQAEVAQLRAATPHPRKEEL